jgi:hypothetical protein
VVDGVGQARLDVAAVAVEAAAQDALDLGAVVRGQPAALDEQVGQGHALAGGPGGAGLGEAVAVEQVELEGDDAEQQVAVGVHGWRAPAGEGSAYSGALLI